MPGKPRPRAPLAIFAADDRRGIRHGTLNVVVVAIDSTLPPPHWPGPPSITPSAPNDERPTPSTQVICPRRARR